MVAAAVAVAAVAVLVASLGGSAVSAATKAAPSWCGTKDITISLSDGFGGNSWRRITRAEFEAEATKCPNVKKVIYTDGQGDTQKSISDIKGLVAQGVNAMVVFPDAGKAVLPALRDAYKAGVVTVPYRVTPGGKAGVDYTYFIPTNFKKDGVMWATEVAKLLKGKGNIVYLGGPAGNSESTAKAAGIAEALKKYPGIKQIGQKPFEAGTWDAAVAQKVMTALLAKYPQIDAVFIDFGIVNTFPAFQTAKRKIPVIATEDVNGVGCAAKKQKFGLVTVSSQNWHVRAALHWAVAKAAGGTNPGPGVVTNYVFDNSGQGKIHCDPSLPVDAFLSTHLSKTQLKAALK
jgi:ribose transport system substrate-binding protein